MKFHQLNIGQGFTVADVHYTKVSPVLAQDDDGNQKMMPRSKAVVVDQTAAAEPAVAESKELTPERVERALASTERDLKQVLRGCGLDSDTINTQVWPILNDLRRKLL